MHFLVGNCRNVTYDKLTHNITRKLALQCAPKLAPYVLLGTSKRVRQHDAGEARVVGSRVLSSGSSYDTVSWERRMSVMCRCAFRVCWIIISRDLKSYPMASHTTRTGIISLCFSIRGSEHYMKTLIRSPFFRDTSLSQIQQLCCGVNGFPSMERRFGTQLLLLLRQWHGVLLRFHY